MLETLPLSHTLTSLAVFLYPCLPINTGSNSDAEPFAQANSKRIRISQVKFKCRLFGFAIHKTPQEIKAALVIQLEIAKL